MEHFLGEGDISLTVEGKHSVYVQSQYLDWIHNQAQQVKNEHIPNAVLQTDKVHKFPSGCTHKIFDLRQCYMLMKGQIQQSNGKSYNFKNQFFLKIVIIIENR